MMLFWLGLLGGAVLMGVAAFHLMAPRGSDYGNALETIEAQGRIILRLKRELEELKQKAHW